MTEEIEEIGEAEEKSEEQDELSVTLAEAVRPPQKGELEQLICSELALAVFSTDPLQKIRHVLEAYSLLPLETRKELFTKEERDEFRCLYEVAISFINTVEASPSPYATGRFASVSWSFPSNDVDSYLFWIHRIWWFDVKGFEELYRQLTSNDEKTRERAWSEYLRFLCDYLSSGMCPLSLIKQIQSEFIVYCNPIISKIMRTIFTSVVSSDTWSETLLLMRGVGKGKQTQ